MLSFEPSHPSAVLIAHAENSKTKERLKIYHLPVYGYEKEGTIICDTPEEIMEPHATNFIKKFTLESAEEFAELMQIAINPSAGKRLLRNRALCVRELRELLRESQKKELNFLGTPWKLKIHIDTRPPPPPGHGRQNMVCVAFGKSGSGKSYALNAFAGEDLYKKERSVVYYAHVPRLDPSFKPLRDFYMKNENNIRWKSVNVNTDDPDQEIPLEMSEFEHDVTTIIMDDVSALSPVGKRNAHLRKSLLALQTQLCQTARHAGIFCLFSNHLYHGYSETRFMLNSARWYIMAPRANKKQVLVQLLENDLGFGKKECKRLFNLLCQWGRTFIVHNSAPNFILSEKGIILI